MPKTPDRSPGPLDEEAIYFESTSEATTVGEVRYTGSYFSFYDSDGEYDPRTSGTPDLSKVVLEVSGALVYTGNGEVTTVS